MEMSVETTGETVREAKWAALRELEKRAPGLDKGSVRFEVLSEGERGLLGVGYAPARVVATAAAAERAAPSGGSEPDSDLAAEVREVVERIADVVGVDARVDVREDDEAVSVTCEGPELGMLIGRHGQTIDAIQYLANAIAARGRGADRKQVVVDAAGYRDRRRAILEALALETAERVLATGSRVALEPMSAAERKVVHLRLKEHAGVETTSEGAEPSRCVVVLPAQE